MSQTDRLHEIEARLQAATPGPWVARPSDENCNEWFIERQTGVSDVPLEKFYIAFTTAGFSGLTDRRTMADAALIAHAPEDIRWLLDEVKRLRDALDRCYHFTMGASRLVRPPIHE